MKDIAKVPIIANGDAFCPSDLDEIIAKTNADGSHFSILLSFLSDFILFYFILFYFILFYFILFYFILFYFILFYCN